MTTTQITPRKVPAKALYFDANIAIDVVDGELVVTEALQPWPVTIRARTGGVAYQEFWGACVHDMEGYVPPTSAIAMNYRHDSDEIIGTFPEAPAVVNDELIAKGLIVPFKPDDVASEIIHKGRQKVPYQASIQLDLRTLEVEEIGPNLTVNVNGQEFTGPLFVFRKWAIEAIAITPFGADGDTSVEFSRGDRELSVRCFSSGVVPMSDSAPTDGPLSAFATWFQKSFGMDPAAMTADQQTAFAAAHAAPAPADAELDTAPRMLADFGNDGAVWFAQGKKYHEAAKMFRDGLTAKLTELTDRIKALETENADLKTKANFSRGHQTPAAFTPPADTKQPPAAAANFSGYTEGRQKLIAAIKMPGK